MTRCWLALLEAPVADATAQAQVHDADGSPVGWLAAWRRRAKPVRAARRVDDRIVDPDGEPAWFSLVLPPEGVRLAFDDLAVQQARRRERPETELARDRRSHVGLGPAHVRCRAGSCAAERQRLAFREWLREAVVNVVTDRPIDGRYDVDNPYGGQRRNGLQSVNPLRR